MSAPQFSAAWWLPGPHAQTLWGKFFRRQPLHATRVQRLDTPDGDFLDIHHIDAAPGAPRLVLLHGLEGTIRSHYLQSLLGEAKRRRWGASVLIFRSCGPEMNRTRRFYHSGETTDLAFALETILIEVRESPLLLAGVSLGGNVLLKFLGEAGHPVDPRLVAAAAVSVPFDLSRGTHYIDRGFSRVYQRHFIRSLSRKARAKLQNFPDLVDLRHFGSIRTMHDFDNRLTAPVHGFENADDYYAQSSSLGWLARIKVNTLLLSAVDDPFLPPPVLDEVRDVARKNPALHLDFPPHGGHAGFVGGRNPFNPIYYIERRVGDFLAEQLAAASPQN
ncbi:MAG: hypothetical protein M3Q09_10680 [Gemmatimonadota bacterium]|nr:hypothetical protein [Gemmatimonadota bacterium]